MHYSEAAISGLHEARSARLRAGVKGHTRKSRGWRLSNLLTRGDRKVLAPAPTAQPAHSG
jgi:hypothetical protein